MVCSMTERPLIFALANPDPEVSYNVVERARPDAIFASGRSDYPNQVNNVLAFPSIFRGALDVRATRIDEQMKLAACRGIAAVARRSTSFGRDCIIPMPLDAAVLPRVAAAVAGAAVRTGVASRPLTDLTAYSDSVAARVRLSHRSARTVRRPRPRRATGEHDSLWAALAEHRGLRRPGAVHLSVAALEPRCAGIARDHRHPWVGGGRAGRRTLDLVVTVWVLHAAAVGAGVVLIVLFQPELRHALNTLEAVLKRSKRRGALSQALEVVSAAAFSLAGAGRGALLVLTRHDSVNELLPGGVPLGGHVSPEILEAIFRKVSPVHDGATIVKEIGSRGSERCSRCRRTRSSRGHGARVTGRGWGLRSAQMRSSWWPQGTRGCDADARQRVSSGRERRRDADRAQDALRAGTHGAVHHLFRRSELLLQSVAVALAVVIVAGTSLVVAPSSGREPCLSRSRTSGPD